MYLSIRLHLAAIHAVPTYQLSHLQLCMMYQTIKLHFIAIYDVPNLHNIYENKYLKNHLCRSTLPLVGNIYQSLINSLHIIVNLSLLLHHTLHIHISCLVTHNLPSTFHTPSTLALQSIRISHHTKIFSGRHPCPNFSSLNFQQKTIVS